MSENPLTKQQSLEDIAKQCVEQCENSNGSNFDKILTACLKSKATGIDECINAVDSMLNSSTSQLNKIEKQILVQTLDNLRVSYAYKRALIIKKIGDNDER